MHIARAFALSTWRYSGMPKLYRLLNEMILGLTRLATAVNRVSSRLLAGLLRFARTVERIVLQLLSGLLTILDATYKWLVSVARRIVEYLGELIPALWNVLTALLKLGLFYAPSILFIVVRPGGTEGWAVALIWAGFITAIGLTYGSSEGDPDGDRH